MFFRLYRGALQCAWCTCFVIQCVRYCRLRGCHTHKAISINADAIVKSVDCCFCWRRLQMWFEGGCLSFPAHGLLLCCLANCIAKIWIIFISAKFVQLILFCIILLAHVESNSKCKIRGSVWRICFWEYQSLIFLSVCDLRWFVVFAATNLLAVLLGKALWLRSWMISKSLGYCKTHCKTVRKIFIFPKQLLILHAITRISVYQRWLLVVL